MHISTIRHSFDKFTHHYAILGLRVLRFKLKELIAEKEFREGRIVSLVEISEQTGIHRMTLSRIANHRDANPTADVLDRLCTFFACPINALVEHQPPQRNRS